ncbi:roadblock/LC7 domain-containing protein [Kitasatospora sp. NPDC059088]|uniref:roadblock/LC7 domain-containing protein n=1 Tax=Kitasatospora sp. NPDC059088 TaxID=3346722 RepID=UPI0036877705
MIGTTHRTGELNWLLDELVQRAPEVSFTVMLSADGLAMASSAGLTREDGEHLAAVAAGFHSLAKGAGRHFGAGEVRQTMVELEGGYLLVAAAGEGTCLAVFATARADLGLVAYEMARLVRRVGEHLSATPRTPHGG